MGLAQHRVEQAPHELQHPLLQLIDAGGGATQAPVGQGETPDALDRIDAVPHPGIAVVAVDVVGGAGGEQAGDRVLALQHHLIDLAVQFLQVLPGFSGTQLQRCGAVRNRGAAEGHGRALPEGQP